MRMLAGLDAAAEVASEIADKFMACEAWRVLSRVNANTQRLDAGPIRDRNRAAAFARFFRRCGWNALC
jgi:hypothetical protein